MNIHCSTCNEPWNVFYLLGDAIYEIGLSIEECEAWQLLPIGKEMPARYRKQFRSAGWEFGETIVNVIRCPDCMSAKRYPIARFRVGRIVVIPKVLSAITQEDILIAITRHQAGDWGDVRPQDRIRNEQALLAGKRIISSFRSAKGLKFSVITEADRSATTLLLPEDY